MNILIIYGTTEGQTRKIARFMEDVLLKSGNQVTIADASDNPPSPAGFDAIIIGGSIHVKKYQSAISHYITTYCNVLNKIPGAFYSVCLAVVSDHKEEHIEVDKIKNDFLKQCGWEPLISIHIAGALKYTEYDFFKRLIMKMISKKEGRTTNTSRDYEYTDWDQVKSFVNDFISISTAMK